MIALPLWRTRGAPSGLSGLSRLWRLSLILTARSRNGVWIGTEAVGKGARVCVCVCALGLECCLLLHSWVLVQTRVLPSRRAMSWFSHKLRSTRVCLVVCAQVSAHVMPFRRIVHGAACLRRHGGCRTDISARASCSSSGSRGGRSGSGSSRSRRRRGCHWRPAHLSDLSSVSIAEHMWACLTCIIACRRCSTTRSLSCRACTRFAERVYHAGWTQTRVHARRLAPLVRSLRWQTKHVQSVGRRSNLFRRIIAWRTSVGDGRRIEFLDVG
jgi:hypothetical protein